MAVKLSEKAAEQVQKLRSEMDSPETKFLRIGVRGGGCGGFEYNLHFDDSFDEVKDSKTEQFGVPVVVDKKSDLLLDGTVIDFYYSIERQGFVFENPNATKTCGCGSSFQA